MPIVLLMSSHNNPTESEVAIFTRKSLVSSSILLIKDALYEGKNNLDMPLPPAQCHLVKDFYT